MIELHLQLKPIRRIRMLALLSVLVIVAIAIIGRVTRVPEANTNEPRSGGGRHCTSVTESTIQMYGLPDGVTARYIPYPNSNDRDLVCLMSGFPAGLSILSLTVEWDGYPQARLTQLGPKEYVPRSLLDVMTQTLRIPIYDIDNPAVAARIPLSGDWILRKGSPVCEYLEDVENEVRRSGEPHLRIIAVPRIVRVYTVHGIPRDTTHVFNLFPPVPDLPVPPRTGSLDAFLSSLGRAIECPVVNACSEKHPASISWVDNSAANKAWHGGRLAQTWVDTAVADTKLWLGVEIDPAEVTREVWRIIREPSP